MQEADLVVERQNATMGSAALLMQMMISSIPNMGVKPESTKSIGKAFAALVKRLIGDA